MVFELPESIRPIDKLDNLPTVATVTTEVCEKEAAAPSINCTTTTMTNVKMTFEKKKQKHVNPISAIKLAKNGNVILPAIFAGVL